MADTTPYAKVRPGLWVDQASGRNVHLNAGKARSILRRYGFDVKATGPANDRLLDAWKTYRRAASGGVVHPQEAASHWNTGNGSRTRNPGRGGKPIVGGSASEMVSPGVTTGKNKRDFVRAVTKPVNVPGSHHKTNPKNPPPNNSKGHPSNPSAGRVSSGGGAKIAASASVNQLIKAGYADQLAGMQFDPAIRAAQLAQAKGGADAAQHQRDIAGWGSQVKASQATATTRDQQAGAAARSDVSNLAQAIQNSLGGSRGAGVVGAAALNDQTALAGEGAAQDRYNADLAPILQAQSSDQAARQRALDSQSALQLASQLTDLQGQRGQAKSKAAMDILTANNAARQSNFGNRLALVNANLAAQAAGLDQLKTAAMIDQYGISNKINLAKLHAGQVAAKQASGHPDWAVLDPGKRQQLVDNAIATAAGQLPPGIYDPTHIMNSALATIRAGGYGSARKAGAKGVPSRKNQASILGLLQQRLSYYHGQHPAGGAAPVA